MLLINPLSENETVEKFNTEKTCKVYKEFGIFSWYFVFAICKNFCFASNINGHYYELQTLINPIQDRFFLGCSRIGGGEAPLALNLSRISYKDETWHSYTLPKEDTKNIWITWHTPWVFMTSALFHQKLDNFAISRNTDIDFILIHNF